jgi:hypothetical protein
MTVDHDARRPYIGAVKILALLTSDVHGGDARIAASALFPSLMQDALSEALGEPVEIAARAVWPKPNLPQVVDGWMHAVEPDLVMLSVSSFWFLYESVPLRLRKFGRPGEIVDRACRTAAATPWLAHNRPFQALRRTVQRGVGGRAHFEPGEVIKTCQLAIRSILQREGAYLVVVGPAGGDEWATDAAAARRIRERRQHVHDAMQVFCRSLHVEYWDAGVVSKMADPQPASRQGDQLHLDEQGHKRLAEYYLDASVQLCRRAQAHAQSAVRVGPSDRP